AGGGVVPHHRRVHRARPAHPAPAPGDGRAGGGHRGRARVAGVGGARRGGAHLRRSRGPVQGAGRRARRHRRAGVDGAGQPDGPRSACRPVPPCRAGLQHPDRRMTMSTSDSAADGYEVIVVGAGLAGLVAAHELALAGKRVHLLDQENRNNLGGQAFWSLGGLFMVDTPEQRRLGIKDSYELAWQDWQGSAGFDREDEDHWARQWAQAYVRFAATEKRDYLRDLGLRVTPLVGWAERGGGAADGHGNSVPRFHITWGTGPEVVRVFAEPVQAAERRGLVKFSFRHRVDELIVENDAVVGVRGSVLEPTDLERGKASSRTVVGDFEFRAKAVVVTSGGIGHNHALIRQNWPVERLGPCPETLISGVPAHVDGRMLAISEAAGGAIVNRDRMWHYTEGIHNWDPVWPDHAIR